MEEDLKLFKVEYRINRFWDYTQIFTMEDNLEILKVEYLTNHLLDPTQILNLGFDVQTIMYKSFKEEDHQWKTKSKY